MEAAQNLGLHFHDSAGASVIVANGDRVVCRGLARDVATRIGSEFFTIECYAIPLDCFDMVLAFPSSRHWARSSGILMSCSCPSSIVATTCDGGALIHHREIYHQQVAFMH